MECISGLERFAWFRSALTHGHSGFEPLRNPLALLKVQVQVATSHGILRASVVLMQNLHFGWESARVANAHG